jgi:iron complex transport system substrate-binding protein
MTETLFALGVGHRLVGVTTFCDYPTEALRIQKIGTYTNPSIEAVLALRPDLVVAAPEGTDQEKIKRLETLGLKVAVLPVSSAGTIFESIRLLARIVHREEAGTKLLLGMQHQIDSVRRNLKGVRPRRVLLVVGYRPLVAAGSRTHIGELLSLAGGENITGETQQSWPILSAETIVARAPEVIIEAGMGSERDAEKNRWQDLSSLPAVKEGRIYPYPSDKILRPGPRIGEALEELARLIHPECFVRGPAGRERSCEGS